MTDVAVIGAGNIGGTLGRKWGAAGHTVTFAAREPDKPALRELAQAARCQIAAIPDAVRGARVVLLALPGAAVAETVSALGGLLSGKAVIDAANNVRSPVMNSADMIMSSSPGAVYFRAFNTLGWEVLAKPSVGGVQSDMFFCGPDGTERTIVEGLITDAGLRPIWVGGPSEAGTVDGVLRLWFTLVTKQGHSRHMALKLIED